MDPEANLQEQLEISKRLLSDERDDAFLVAQNLEDAKRLAELVQALHEWIRSGGFPPDSWAHP